MVSPFGVKTQTEGMVVYKMKVDGSRLSRTPRSPDIHNHLSQVPCPIFSFVAVTNRIVTVTLLCMHKHIFTACLNEHTQTQDKHHALARFHDKQHNNIMLKFHRGKKHAQ